MVCYTRLHLILKLKIIRDTVVDIINKTNNLWNDKIKECEAVMHTMEVNNANTNSPNN